MMTNLFSMFDPSTAFMSMSWMMIPLCTALMINSMKAYKSKMKNASIAIIQKIEQEIKELTKEKKLKMAHKHLSLIFLTVMLLNVLAVLPFNFAVTAHMSITMVMAMTMWMALMINAMKNSFSSTMIHLTPMGTPNALMNFMVIIEMVSNCIRPITLSIRLTANMVAGHLLMSLLSNFSLMSTSNLLMSTIPMVTLICLESAVAIIQAYVITILTTLYYKETF